MIFTLLYCLLPMWTINSHVVDRPDLAVRLIPAEFLENANSVIRESSTTYEISSPRIYSETVRESVTVLNSESDYDELYVGYDQYSKAKIISAEIYDASGKQIRKFAGKDINDMSAFGGTTLYADNRVLSIDMIGGAYPYTVSYTYVVNYSETQYYSPWRTQGYNTSVMHAEMTLVHPVSLQIETLAINGQLSVSDTTISNFRKRTWTLSKVSAVRAEPMAPPSYELFPFVYFAPMEFIVDKYTGTMKDWRSFGKFMHELNAGREKLSPELSATVRALTANVTENHEKVRVLYRYLQESMRYVSVQLGIGGWQTHDALYVERNKYGDCKALSYFMKGMLSAVGIEAWPVLINLSSGQRFFSEEFVTPGSFNHMILYLPNEDLWLECTSKNNPVGYLHDVSNDRMVVLITPEGGIVSRTPAQALDISVKESRDSAFVQDGIWHLSGTRKCTGAAHEEYRIVNTYLSQEEKERTFRKDFSLTIKQLHTLAYSVSVDSLLAECTYTADLTQFGSISGSRMFLPVNPLYRFETRCTSDARTQRIYWDKPLHESNEIFLETPEGYIVESAVSDKHVTDSVFGEYKLSMTVEGRQVHIRRLLRIPRFTLDADQYPALCTFFTTVQASDRGTIVLKKMAE